MTLTDQQKEQIKLAIKDWIATTYFENHISISFNDDGLEIEFGNMFTDDELNKKIASIIGAPIHSAKYCKNVDEWWMYLSDKEIKEY